MNGCIHATTVAMNVDYLETMLLKQMRVFIQLFRQFSVVLAVCFILHGCKTVRVSGTLHNFYYSITQ